MKDLSVIIPARNEVFLRKTIDSVISASQADTEIIAILDGYWPEGGIPDDPRVKLVHHTEPIGQRAATNEGAKLSDAKYIMKLDAHCKLADGFDRMLMNDCEYDWTVIPRMYTLDAFHWICLECKNEMGQGPLPDKCDKCESIELEQKIIWRQRKKTDYMWFDTDLRVHYFDNIGLNGYNKDKNRYSHKLRPWAQGSITDVLCGVGACFFMHRDRYWELGGMDENHGSWGQMAVEVAMKAWLSGGRHVVNKNTWFAHLFRTRPGFTWPYSNPATAQEKARKYSRDLWLNNKWSGQKKDIDWLIQKFHPLPGWDSL